MTKNIFKVLMLQFLLIGSSYAKCDLDIFKFGSSYEKVSQIIGDVPIISVSTPNRLFVPGEIVCNDETLFEGTPVFFIFLEDNLFRIELTRYNFGKGEPSLVSWAESQYGKIEKKPKSFYDSRPNASWYWDQSNALIKYFVESDESGFAESIFIESKNHSGLIDKQVENDEASAN
jgi:hypothetical protein